VAEPNETQNTEADDQAIEDAAFAKVMAESVQGDAIAPASTPEPVKEVKEPESETKEPGVKAEVTDTKTTDTGEPAAEREEVFEGFTAEELKTQLSEIPRLQKALDKTNGTYGQQLQQLNATIAQLQEAATKQPETPALTPDSLKNLQEDYPELAEKLASDLSGIINQSAAPDIASIEQKMIDAIDARWNDRIRQDSMRALETAHPDWRDVAGISTVNGIQRFNDLNFGNWVAKQPKETQEQIIESTDAHFLAGKITEYKKTLESTEKSKSKPNLDLAVVPEGNVSSERVFESEDAEIDAAFAATMKKLARAN